MTITSNDSILLEKFYYDLKRERLNVEMEKIPEKDSMGWIPSIKINLSLDFTEMFKAWLEYKKYKLYLLSQQGKKEIKSLDVIDTEVENTKLLVEFDEKKS